MTTTGGKHRPEIDGLRAIAVLAVVFYHFSVPGFSGGFVGVDIFFVISGFLIGDILWREYIRSGTISLISFYARRIRRLAPAFCVMSIVTLLASYLILLPYEFREFGKTLIAATVYLSNVYFYRQSGYFDAAADEKPLLHTWSLSVEEQFYIFLPIIIIIACKKPRLIILILALTFITSLILNIVITPVSHTAAFYLFPFRAWELLSGVLLAIYGNYKNENWQHAAWISWSGLSLLLASILFTKPGTAFPGWQAIVPVFATTLILLNGQHNNSINKYLSYSPVIFIGLISYSLYLWHWPIFTFINYYKGNTSTIFDNLSGITLSFVLAYLSWRLVEQPVRYGFRLGNRAIYSGALAVSLLFLTFGSMLYLRDGLPGRFNADIRAHIDASADFLQDWSRCTIATNGPLKGVETCPLGPEGPPTYLVWGDSHVRAFKEGLSLLAREHKKPGLLIWRAGCPPLFDIEKQESAATRQQDAQCTAANDRIRKAIPQMKGIESILLIGRWSYYSEGQGVGRDAFNRIAIKSTLPSRSNHTNQAGIFNHAVQGTVAELSRNIHEIFVLRQVPEIPEYDSRDAARRLAHNRLTPQIAETTLFNIAREGVRKRMQNSEEAFHSLADQGKITWLQSHDRFCSKSFCSALKHGRALYFDNNHITNQTAISIRDIFIPLMTSAHKTVKKSEASN